MSMCNRQIFHDINISGALRRRNEKNMSDITFPAVVKAIQEAAQAYGVAEMAGQMDMKPSSLYNALNPWGDRGTAKLGLEQALFIMRETGNTSAFVLMAAELGFRVVPVIAVPDHQDTREEMLDDNNMLTDFHAAIRNGASLMVVQAKAAAAHRDIDETVEQYRWELAKQEVRG